MQSDSDTRLARHLYHAGRVEQAALQGLLSQAQAGAAPLGALLVHRGLLTPAELAEAQAALESQSVAPEVGPHGTRKDPSSGVVQLPSSAGAPQSIGGYRLLQLLGAGGMGAVYLGEHEATGQRCAVKLLPSRSVGARRERFRREGQAQALADAHPNVTKVHSAGEENDHLYLVMDLCEGGDLAERLEASGPLPADEAAKLCAALADGLQHVHEKGVLHRDLKPANVLFGADGAPMLVDFGLAKEVDAETLTKTGAMLGTPAYMSPEQAKGQNRELDARTDVYSLGVILYELLTGQLPFSGPGIALIRAVIQDAPPRPRSINPRVPRWLERVCLKALSKSPDARFGSAAEFAAALRTPAPAGPSRAALALTLAAVALAVAGVATWATQRDDRPGVAPRESEPVADRPVASTPAPPVPLSDEELREGKKRWRVIASLPPSELHAQGSEWLKRFAGHPQEADARSRVSAARLEFPLVTLPFDDVQVARVRGDQVVTGHVGGTFRVWELDPEPRVVSSFMGPLEVPALFEISADGASSVLSREGAKPPMLHHLELPSGKSLAAIPLPFPARRLALSPDGRTAIVAGNETAISLNLETQAVEHEFGGHANPIYCMALSADASLLLTGSGLRIDASDVPVIENQVRLWNVASGALRFSVGTQTRPNTVAFLPDGERFVVGTHFGLMMLFDLASGSELGTWTASRDSGMFGGMGDSTRAHSGGVTSLAVLSERRVVTFGGEHSKARQLRVWSMEGEELFALPKCEVHPAQVDPFADGRRLLIRTRHYKDGVATSLKRALVWPLPPAR